MMSPFIQKEADKIDLSDSEGIVDIDIKYSRQYVLQSWIS
jgi:hypothetical protein